MAITLEGVDPEWPRIALTAGGGGRGGAVLSLSYAKIRSSTKRLLMDCFESKCINCETGWRVAWYGLASPWLHLASPWLHLFTASLHPGHLSFGLASPWLHLGTARLTLTSPLLHLQTAWHNPASLFARPGFTHGEKALRSKVT